ncbi:MAG TPA: hypothetical protein VH915_10125, partial [Pedococcus sp.]
GVTDSRVSQLRAEAVTLLRGALAAALDAETGARPAETRPAETRPAETRPAETRSCATRRRQAYYAQVAGRRSFAARLSEPAPTAVPA